MKIRLPLDQAFPPKPVVTREVEFLGDYPVTVDYMNSVWGEISKFGAKVMPDGRIWVIHGLTNKPVQRHEVVPSGSDGKGNIIYLKTGEKMRPGLDTIYPSVWLNPKKAAL